MEASLPEGAQRVTWFSLLALRLATALRLPGTRCQDCRAPYPATAEFPCGCVATLCLPCVANREVAR